MLVKCALLNLEVQQLLLAFVSPPFLSASVVQCWLRSIRHYFYPCACWLQSYRRLPVVCHSLALHTLNMDTHESMFYQHQILIIHAFLLLLLLLSLLFSLIAVIICQNLLSLQCETWVTGASVRWQMFCLIYILIFDLTFLLHCCVVWLLNSMICF